jgi:para-nitrobenzyl esterase
LGDLRWKPPQAPTAWTGVRDAIAWADQAAQNPVYQAFGEGSLSEDCLYLNVTAPKDAVNLPVMVYFHGGGFATLTGNSKAFNNAASLPTKGVVLVSVNHRLGVFGYMAHPWLTAESAGHGSGNYGQLDQVQALTWVKNNIVNFGGNPNSVTIFGESGGGGKVLYLMTSPQAAGLFHKAICESGMYSPDTRSLASAEAQGTAMSTNLGATTLAQLRAKPWTEIEIASRTTVVTVEPNVDGWHLPNTMRNIYEAGTQNDVPFISGMNKKDMAFGITALIEYMPWMATKRRTNTYVYMFNRVPAGWADKGILAYHGSELLYVFNYPLSAVSHYLLGLVIDPATGVKMVIGDLNGNGVTGSAGDTADVIASEGWSAADTAVADTMMTIWTNFAKTGNPSTTTFTWPAYTAANDTYAELGTTPAAKTGLATAFQ